MCQKTTDHSTAGSEACKEVCVRVCPDISADTTDELLDVITVLYEYRSRIIIQDVPIFLGMDSYIHVLGYTSVIYGLKTSTILCFYNQKRDDFV